ncbi:MAG: T9SS type A sorting domain-containing protein [Ignavibacteriaceae bacterium]|nr:T9SS type A sorting domain-containing protein [Ignavibacteriaceae bacterium]
MKKYFYFVVVIILTLVSFGFNEEGQNSRPQSNPPIYIAFLWHMHQPIYWPYESVVQTHLNNRYPFSIFDIFNQRTGPYTSWPKTAVQKGINAGMPHFGSQVSFSGSLIENLNNLENYGNSNFANWKSHWNNIKNQNTSLGNPRMDMVGFGYHHPLMGLIDYTDIRKQIQDHKQIFAANFPGTYSKGIFPPENAFSPRMIPALLAEGIEWVLVDNIHFERACENYPFNTGGNIYEPNKSDIQNPDPGDWIQLNGLWAPTKVSAQWSRQPKFVAHIDPETGIEYKMIAVPTDRYLGNEDGRGGFGALNYEAVLSQLEPYNTDPNHPILVVLHHDGDNYGGGSESYYNSNFQAFVNWLQANPTRFVCTTIQDYLEMFPPNPGDVIHIEDGSWSGADNGDPEFKKWNGDPNPSGYSPDRNSWGIITAAKNFVQTAEQINSSSNDTKNAWKYFLNGQASDYWYWDGSLNGIWDSHSARAANLAIPFAQIVVNSGTDLTGPTIYTPQREPYNPGGTEWGQSMPSDFKVWTYVFDVNGLQSVKLKYRTDLDGVNNPDNNHNETYIGGSDVTSWTEVEMTGLVIPSQTNPSPLFKAKEYSAQVNGFDNKLLDYYVEAVDNGGNISRSPIRSVWVGNYSGGGSGGNGVSWSPTNPTKDDTITIVVAGVNQGGRLHWGVNNNGSAWQTPNQVYWPAGSYLFNGTGPAVESPMNGPVNDTLKITIGPFNNSAQTVERIAFVIHFNDNTWNNNNGNDFHITIGTGGGGGTTYVMDGQLDPSAELVSSNNGLDLYLGWNGIQLYTATQSAQSTGSDHFIFISDSQYNMITAPWAKTGMVAQWGAFLGNESTNNWSGWFDQQGLTQNSAGSFLEGTINIQGEFGYQPQKIYIAVGSYTTTDGGNLNKQVPAGNGDGNIDSNELYEFDFVLSVVEAEKELPKDFVLYQNYPNPFNPATKIKYSIPALSLNPFSKLEGTFVTLKVYDILGNEVGTLVNEEQQPGVYEVEFSASNLSSGIYFYKLQTGSYTDTKKMILMK